MFYCDKCSDTNCCERTDLWNEPVLCDKCYDKAKILQKVIIFVCCLCVVALGSSLRV